jgi:Asp/Glu/hydantoin racemase
VRILVLNPNMTEAVTSLMTEAGRAAAAPGTTLVPMTAPRGLPYLSSRAEAQIGGAILLELLAEAAGSFDAAIVAAFGDPGLWAARELFDFPVVGISEAAMLTACMLGQRFAIVTFMAAMRGWYRDCVEQHGLLGRYAGCFTLEAPPGPIAAVQEQCRDQLVELAKQAARESDAHVLIFAGAPLAGLAAKVQDLLPLPVLDPIAAAVKQAEALVTLGCRKASVGTFSRPAAKSSIGLAPALAARLGHSDS